HTRSTRDWSSDVCSSDLLSVKPCLRQLRHQTRPHRTGDTHSQPMPVRNVFSATERKAIVFDKFGEAQRYHFTGEEKERVSPKERSEERRVGKEGRTRRSP